MAVRVSVLAPVTSLALAEALSPGELAERAAATFGVEAKSLTFFRLVELKEEAAAPLAGHFACAVESSELSLESIERLLTENRRLQANLERTAQALTALGQEMERMQSAAPAPAPAPASEDKEEALERERKRAAALEAEVASLRQELEHSNRVRKESKQMLDLLKKEFQVLVRDMAREETSDARATVVGSTLTTASQPPPPLAASARSAAPRARYLMSLELDTLPSAESELSFKLVGSEGATDNVAIPFPRLKVSRKAPRGPFHCDFEFAAERVGQMRELWLWSERSESVLPCVVRAATLQRIASASGGSSNNIAAAAAAGGAAPSSSPALSPVSSASGASAAAHGGSASPRVRFELSQASQLRGSSSRSPRVVKISVSASKAQ